jgi:hypothetical protein
MDYFQADVPAQGEARKLFPQVYSLRLLIALRTDDFFRRQQKLAIGAVTAQPTGLSGQHQQVQLVAVDSPQSRSGPRYRTLVLLRPGDDVLDQLDLFLTFRLLSNPEYLSSNILITGVGVNGQVSSKQLFQGIRQVGFELGHRLRWAGDEQTPESHLTTQVFQSLDCLFEKTV